MVRKMSDKTINEIEDKIESFVSFVSERLDSLNYENVWKYILIKLVQYFLGPDDEIEKILIKAKNDKGEPYVITIT